MLFSRKVLAGRVSASIMASCERDICERAARSACVHPFCSLNCLILSVIAEV